MHLRKRITIVLVSFLFLVSLFAGIQNAHANGAGSLVETQWVADNVKNVKLVYVGFVTPDEKKKYEGKHIEGSVFLDMNQVMGALTATPDKAKFEEMMGSLGIGNDSKVVLYSTPAANPFVPATYWIMKYFGHSNVSIMNGSFDKWNAEGRATTANATAVTTTKYTAGAGDPSIFVDGDFMLKNHKNVVVIDTRGPDEFKGETKRDYIKTAGHIPGALNLNFYPSNRNGNGTYKSADDLKKVYEAAGVTKDKEIVTYCEGGPRATDTFFVLKELLGYSNVKVYIGSWMQWGNDAEKYPVEK